MNTRIDTEELLVELREQHIDVDITRQSDGIMVQLTNIPDNTVLGVIRRSTVEGAIAGLIRKLADDSKMLKEKVNVIGGLTKL